MRSDFHDRYVELKLERTNSRDNFAGADNDKERTKLAVTLRDSRIGIAGDAWQYAVEAAYGTFTTSVMTSARPFQKLNGDVAYTRALPNGMQFSGSVAAQWAFTDLEGGERMVISGAGGVRGHPAGDAGDVALLGRFELQKLYELPYVGGMWTDGGFVDAGVLQYFTFAPDGVENVAQRYGYGVSLAWNVAPGTALRIERAWPVGPAADENPRGQVWLQASYRF